MTLHLILDIDNSNIIIRKQMTKLTSIYPPLEVKQLPFELLKELLFLVELLPRVALNSSHYFISEFNIVINLKHLHPVLLGQ